MFEQRMLWGETLPSRTVKSVLREQSHQQVPDCRSDEGTSRQGQRSLIGDESAWEAGALGARSQGPLALRGHPEAVRS